MTTSKTRGLTNNVDDFPNYHNLRKTQKEVIGNVIGDGDARHQLQKVLDKSNTTTTSRVSTAHQLNYLVDKPKRSLQNAQAMDKLSSDNENGNLATERFSTRPKSLMGSRAYWTGYERSILYFLVKARLRRTRDPRFTIKAWRRICYLMNMICEGETLPAGSTLARCHRLTSADQQL